MMSEKGIPNEVYSYISFVSGRRELRRVAFSPDGAEVLIARGIVAENRLDEIREWIAGHPLFACDCAIGG